MKKIFIYYSLTGNGDLVSKHLESKNIEVRKIKTLMSVPKSFIGRIITLGFLAMINYKGKLSNFDFNLDKYEEIIIGSPIWNGRFPPAINSVLKKTDFTLKDVTFILYSGSGTGKNAEKKIKKHFCCAKIIFLKEPKKYPNELNKLKESDLI